MNKIGFFILVLIVFSGCKTTSLTINHKSVARIFKVEYTINLPVEDSAATITDVQEYAEFILKMIKLPSNNHFYEYGIDELWPSKPIVTLIEK